MQRSRNYAIAAVLAGVIALANTIYAIAALPQGKTHSDSAHSGIPLGPNPTFQMLATLFVLVSATVIYLLVRRDRSPA